MASTKCCWGRSGVEAGSHSTGYGAGLLHCHCAPAPVLLHMVSTVQSRGSPRQRMREHWCGFKPTGHCISRPSALLAHRRGTCSMRASGCAGSGPQSSASSTTAHCTIHTSWPMGNNIIQPSQTGLTTSSLQYPLHSITQSWILLSLSIAVASRGRNCSVMKYICTKVSMYKLFLCTGTCASTCVTLYTYSHKNTNTTNPTYVYMYSVPQTLHLKI